MFSGIGEVEFTGGGIHFSQYPFVPASVWPGGFVAWKDVAEISVQAAPPEVWLRNGEILFVSAVHEEPLEAWARQVGVPVVERYDLWDLILEPFLDTTFSKAMQERSLEILDAHGLSREEVEGLRAEVAKAMTAYNFDSGLWEWVHLGLFDLLHAQQAKLSVEEFRRYYGRAMAVARRAARLGAGGEKNTYSLFGDDTIA